MQRRVGELGVHELLKPARLDLFNAGLRINGAREMPVM